MMSSRGMGAIAKSKMPSGTRKSRYAGGGKLPAAYIDGDEFVTAAQRNGLDDLDIRVLNKIVDLVNQGETVEAAAKKVAGKK
jgi:tetrahydromethanopterin S-methyltransferase subunit G